MDKVSEYSDLSQKEQEILQKFSEIYKFFYDRTIKNGYVAELDLSRSAIHKCLHLVENSNNLQDLDLHRTIVSDISTLKHLKELRKLDLYQMTVSDVSPLKNLTKLRYLDLERTPVEDISPISSLKKLWYLNLNYTKLSDLTPLRNLKT